MNSPALALTGQVWRRHRLGLSICAGVWLVMVALAMVVPPAASHAGPEDGPLLAAHFIFLIGSFVPMISYVICVFVYNRDGPLEDRESAFPKWTFRLPVRTSSLVAWPMLQATAVTSAVWGAWNVTVLWPTGLDVPLLWPALVVAAVMAWLQAVSWFPHPLPLVRIVTLVLAVGMIALIPICGINSERAPIVWMPLLAAFVPAAYAVALVGVAKARHGDTPEWTWPQRLWKAVRDRLPRRRTGFESALQAQAWFEWRVRGIGIPFIIGVLLVVWVPIFLVGSRVIKNLESPESPTLMAVAGTLTTPGLFLMGLVGLLPLYMGLLGLDLGGVLYKGHWIHDARAGCHPFLGLRPLSDGEIVLAKMRMAARCTLTSWGLALVVVGMTVGLTGAWRELAAAPILEPFSAGDVCVGVVAGAAILVVITWLRLVDNLWVGLSGEPWLIRTVAIIGSIAWLPVSYSVWWLYQRPTGLTTLQTVAFAAVVVKFVLAAWLARRLVCRRILGAPSVTLSLVAWMTVAVGAITLMSKLLPAERVPLVLAAAGIMLLMPLNRLAAAPLVLAWNRHR
jgi:hypothetical protein